MTHLSYLWGIFATYQNQYAFVCGVPWCCGDMTSSVIQLIPKFHGLDSESPYLHRNEFDEVCATLQYNNITDDIVKLKLFTFHWWRPQILIFLLTILKFKRPQIQVKGLNLDLVPEEVYITSRKRTI